jgi:hypothetical protein
MAEALAQERLSAASDLVDLQRALAHNPDVEEIRKRLDGLIGRIAVKAS